MIWMDGTLFMLDTHEYEGFQFTMQFIDMTD